MRALIDCIVTVLACVASALLMMFTVLQAINGNYAIMCVSSIVTACFTAAVIINRHRMREDERDER